MAGSTRTADASTCCAVDLTEAVEDYLKAIYHLSYPGPATPSAIAVRLEVAAPSVTAMVKRLSAASLVHHEPRAGVTLTDHGQEHALRIIRRHRLLETFLAQVLGVPWDQVHAEAEVLEHALSDQLEDRIDAVLGRPTRDPHGDPIPPKAGSHVERWGAPLDSVEAGVRFTVERVSDRDSEALRYLAGLGIGPTVILTVEERAPFGGPLWVRVGDQRHALGLPLAALVHGSVAE